MSYNGSNLFGDVMDIDPHNNELSKHLASQKHDFEKDIEVIILKQKLKTAAEREYFEDKFICSLGTGAPDGLNSDMHSYGTDMYRIHQQVFMKPLHRAK